MLIIYIIFRANIKKLFLDKNQGFCQNFNTKTLEIWKKYNIDCFFLTNTIKE